MRRSPDHILDSFAAEPPKPVHACAQPGCVVAGEFKAPRSRAEVGKPENYLWFCLEHVRAYNAAWNYYQGMSDSEIERDLRHDTVWQRPTWPLGWRVAGAHIHDPMQVFEQGRETRYERPPEKPRRGAEEEEALAIFDLDPPFGQDELKRRYKSLVKQHHPDANGGSKEAEEKLKLITRAYAFLKARYFG
jgi:hypothetical protein